MSESAGRDSATTARGASSSVGGLGARTLATSMGGVFGSGRADLGTTAGLRDGATAAGATAGRAAEAVVDDISFGPDASAAGGIAAATAEGGATMLAGPWGSGRGAGTAATETDAASSGRE